MQKNDITQSNILEMANDVRKTLKTEYIEAVPNKTQFISVAFIGMLC